MDGERTVVSRIAACPTVEQEVALHYICIERFGARADIQQPACSHIAACTELSLAPPDNRDCLFHALG